MARSLLLLTTAIIYDNVKQQHKKLFRANNNSIVYTGARTKTARRGNLMQIEQQVNHNPHPSSLSGGAQKRVNHARTVKIVIMPKLQTETVRHLLETMLVYKN